MTDPTEYIAWCKKMFAAMHEGASWAVPHSGLIYNRRGGKLVLTAFMPWMPEMEGKITATELLEQQRHAHDENKRHFADAGIGVEDAAGLENAKP